MRVAFFDTHSFERERFEEQNRVLPRPHELVFLEARLTRETAPAARGFAAACVFVNDKADAAVVADLGKHGLRLLALRSAGFNHVDVRACAEAGVRVVRVPSYSPHAVAEHALCLLLALNRKVHRAYSRVRELNFSLEGLVGFDLEGKTVGIVGAGKIGGVFARIMSGLSCRILLHDVAEDESLVKLSNAEYVPLDELYRRSDVVSLHVPLTPQSRHMLDERAFTQMKKGVYLINTSRGALIDTKALIDALKSGRVGAAGLDVYEEEEGVFFNDLSSQVLQDDALARLLTFPNVLVTSHQGFLTHEALTSIAQTTLRNISDFEEGRPLINEVR